MKKSRFANSQIMAILKQADSGAPVPDLCREYGMSSATFYKWRAKFGGMDASMMSRLKELEEENRRLKQMYAEERHKTEVLNEAMEKKWWCHLNPTTPLVSVNVVITIVQSLAVRTPLLPIG